MNSWVIENIVFLLLDFIAGTSLRKNLRQQRRFSRLSENELELLQQDKLRKVLLHAVTTTKFYSPYTEGDTADVYQWLRKFPVIRKKTIRETIDDFLSTKFDKKKLIKYESSGSTGERSLVYLSKEEQSLIRAILIHWWEWNGYRLGDSIFQTGMSEKRGWFKRLKDILLNTHYMKAFNLKEKDVENQLLKFNYNSSSVLFGYASSLYEIAKVAEKNKLPNKFRIAMSQGDKLFSHYKSKIEQVFGCRVVEDYGLNEGFMVGQKVDLPYYYIYSPSVVVEILDDRDQPVNDGEIGRIILTKLDGYAMPLIRYDSGDLGKKLPREKYPVDRKFSFPLLQEVIGRNTDIVETSSGNKLTVHTFTGIFEFFPEIIQFQIIVNQADELLIHYIPNVNFKEEILFSIEKKIFEKTGDNLRIIWKTVQVIEPSKSGKPQILINKMILHSQSDLK